ncbi:MAG: hypothetical protein WAN46_16105 [Gammaproteobacteria bacterium]|jgi:hypothetical protein
MSVGFFGLIGMEEGNDELGDGVLLFGEKLGRLLEGLFEEFGQGV